MKKLLFLISASLMLVFSCSKDNEPTPTTILSITPTSGPKNSIVILMGTNFGSNAADNIVTLNGKACNVTTASTSSLSITIPPGAGSGTINLTVDGVTVQSPNFEYVLTPSVSTLAGSTSGFADGMGVAAQFFIPSGVAVDGLGNVYVADGNNYKIRKINPAGVVSTLAGSTDGFADGAATVAQFFVPVRLAVDASGSVYVADIFNHKIRKVSSAGMVSTLAGSTAGFADGSGTSAQFFFPNDVALDAAGNVYVSESQKIRKISSAGVVTTLAGSSAGFVDGAGTLAKFSGPNGVAVDALGNVYVADRENHKIRKINSAGVVTTLAGSTAGFADGTGAAAQFSSPIGVAVDASGNLYVADSNNHKIRKVTPQGVVTTFAGSTVGFTDGDGSIAQFSNPSGIAIDASGTIYVADPPNNRIRKIVLD